MTLNAKICLLIAVVLILTASIIGVLTMWQIEKMGVVSITAIEQLGRDNIQRTKTQGTRQIQDYREQLLTMKREYLQSQVQTAISALEKAYSIDEQQAIEIIRALRYGHTGKDYFWINDMTPTMVMHPYKPELEGQNLSEFKDPDGKPIFMEMVRVCQAKGQGFIHYSWPKYGADHPQPKLSFVMRFAPKNLVVGTGIYIDDIETLVNQRKAAMEKNIETMVTEMESGVDAVKNKIASQLKQVMRWIFGTSLIIMIVAISASYLFNRWRIIQPLNHLIEILGRGAEQVTAAAGQVTHLSQQLAEGASEQAASIEQTSSSLEQMSSMTRQNADNAQQADGLMKESNQVVQQADETIDRLTASMTEISVASEQTSKIIKTIDEIAFQTNLLALNAAVEAARAGEAGTGFAVVADEVRNLAMRAAEAAKDTADLIEGTVKKVTDGSELVSRTNDAFAQVAQSAKKVGELVGEIAAASNEQAQGIGQVNTAVNQMDKVVQQNAANAEASAGASEQMNAQAKQMNATVRDLIGLIGGVRI